MKMIKHYVGNELVKSTRINEYFPHKLLEFFSSENPKVIDITNFEKVPEYEMIWDGEKFNFAEDNENKDYKNLWDVSYLIEFNKSKIPLDFLTSDEDFVVLALLDGNIFKETMMLNKKIDEKTYAIYMSNPHYEIVNIDD